MTGFSAALQFVPAEHSNSYYAAVEASTVKADLILRGYRDLNYGSTVTNKVGFSLSRLIVIRCNLSLFPTVSGSLAGRVATENLFGSSDENYVTIGSRKNYHHNRLCVAAGLPASLSLPSRTTVSVDLKAAYMADEEYLTEPSRKLKTDFMQLSATLGATQRFSGHWTIGANAGINARNILSTSALWGGLDLTSPVGQATLDNYQMASCNASSLSAGLSLSRAIKSVAVTLSVEYSHTDYRRLNVGDHIISYISLVF